MKLTLAKLLQLSMRGIGAESLRLYLCAYCWAMEGGSWHIPCAALANLPGAPRGKAFGRVVSELLAAGLIIADGDGYEVPERVTAAANRMRNWRANNERNGYASGDVTVESNGGGAAPSPLASPLPDISNSGSVVSESSSALSSGSKPVSKPARVARWRFVPTDWQPKDAHRELAKTLRVDIEKQALLFREHEFKDPKSDADKAFNRWLRTASSYAGVPGVIVPQNPRTAAADAAADESRRRQTELELARIRRQAALTGDP